MEKMQKNAEWSFGLERWGKNMRYDTIFLMRTEKNLM